MPDLPAGSFVKFVSTCKLDTLRLGIIKSTETDPKKTTIEGLKQTFQAGVEAEISICPKTSEGQISNKQYDDDVEVQVEPSDQLASLIINEGNDEAGGNFQVKFVPKLPGIYHISAKINGDNLAQSPSNIEVQERKLEVVGELQSDTMIKPAGIAVNSMGMIAVANQDKHCISIFDKEGKFLRQLGWYGENPGELNTPGDVTFVNEDEILVIDVRNNRIQQFNVHSGNFINSFGRFGYGFGQFNSPRSVCMDCKGHIIVSDYNHRVQVLTKDGVPILKFGDRGPEKLHFPVGYAYYKDMFVVADSGNGCLKVFDSSGRFLRKIGEKGNEDGQFTNPWRLYIDIHGNILVGDKDCGHVQQFTMEGRFTGRAVTKLNWPSGIAQMPDGRILISDYEAGKVFFLK